ncbi:MAG: M14 family metallopeptidase [Actinomycetota bacterium]
MRRVMVVAVAAALVATFAPLGRSDEAVLKLVRATPRNQTEASYLMSYFDETHNHYDGEIEILAWPGDLAQLDASGIDYRVVVEDYVAYASEPTAAPAPIRLPGPDRADYRHLADYNAEMEKLAKKNKGLVKLFKMKRPSLEGRPVYGVEIAHNVDAKDGRPTFYIDGIHHAREWPASEYAMVFIHDLVERFGKDPKVTSLLKKARVIAVPIVNVDGFDYSRESLAQNSILGAGNGFEGYWRKNRRSLTGVTAPIPGKPTNPDGYGVDPNRNYAYLWGDSNGGSSGNLLDQTYRGAEPFSEPETQNVRDIILGRPVTGVLTLHTYQGSVLRTGGGEAPDDGDLERIGQKVADILGYKNAPTVGYPTTGTTDDWAYAAMGAYGYTIENGVIGFHPPYADEVGAYWKQHNAAFQLLLAMAADERYHSVIRGTAPCAKSVTVLKSFKTELSPGNPTGENTFPEKLKVTIATERNGSFEFHVGPSTRPYEKKIEFYTLKTSTGSTTKVAVDRGEAVNVGSLCG